MVLIVLLPFFPLISFLSQLVNSSSAGSSIFLDWANGVCPIWHTVLAKSVFIGNKMADVSSNEVLERLDFFDGKPRTTGNDFQGNSVITQPSRHFAGFFGHPLGFSFGSSRFLAFVEIVFVSHVFVPCESIGLVENDLAVDGFRLENITLLKLHCA